MVQIAEDTPSPKAIVELVARGKDLYDTIHDQYDTMVMAMKDNKEVLHMFFESPAPEITNAQLGTLIAYIMYLENCFLKEQKKNED